MTQRIIFDFDNTLFDTEQLKEHLRQFAVEQGLSRQEAQAVYDRARTDTEGNVTISIDNFVAKLAETLTSQGRELPERAARDLHEWLRRSGRELLFPGAEDLLAFAAKDAECYLLSLGVPDWQKEKVALAGIERFIPTEKMIFTAREHGGKIEALRELFGKDFNGSETVLFNDRPEESTALLEAFPQLTMFIHREDRDGRYTNSELWEKLAERFAGRVTIAKELRELFHNFSSYDAERRSRHLGRR